MRFKKAGADQQAPVFPVVFLRSFFKKFFPFGVARGGLPFRLLFYPLGDKFPTEHVDHLGVMRADGWKIGLGKSTEVEGLLDKPPVDRLPAEFFLHELQFELFGYVVAHGGQILAIVNPIHFKIKNLL